MFRRTLIKAAGVAVPLTAGVALAGAPEPAAAVSRSNRPRTYFDKGTRLTDASDVAEPMFSLWDDLDWDWTSNTFSRSVV